MQYIPDNPLVVQSDLTILLEALSPRYAEARDAILPFAELIKSPEYMHTWRISNLTLWNAAASGHTAASVLETLTRLSKYPVPQSVGPQIADRMARYGRLRLTRDGEWLRLEADDPDDLVAGINALVDQVNSEDHPIVAGIRRSVDRPQFDRAPLSYLERNVYDFDRYLATRLSR